MCIKHGIRSCWSKNAVGSQIAVVHTVVGVKLRRGESSQITSRGPQRPLRNSLAKKDILVATGLSKTYENHLWNSPILRFFFDSLSHNAAVSQIFNKISPPIWNNIWIYVYRWLITGPGSTYWYKKPEVDISWHCSFNQRTICRVGG
jgi:hypothetical protein